MEFRIADTFTDSLARLTGEQQKAVKTSVEAPQPVPPKARLFEHVAEEALLSYGVPAEWLQDVCQADEDTLLPLVDHLPSEAAEALLELATGGKPLVKLPSAVSADPFEHPDAQRRFRVMTKVEELARALDYPEY